MGKVYALGGWAGRFVPWSAILTIFLGNLALGATVPETTLIFTADRQSELRTCGCSLDQLGGLARLPAALGSRGVILSGKKAGGLWLDGGDLFFSSLGLAEERLAAEMQNATLLATLYRKWGVVAMTPGPKDLAGGVETLKRLADLGHLKVLSVNLADKKGELLFDPFFVIEHQGVKFGIVGVSGAVPFAPVTELTVLPAPPLLQTAIKKVREQGATIVLVLSQSGIEVDKALAKDSGADFWLSAAATDNLKEPLELGITKVAQLLPWGQQVGLFHLKGGKSRYEAVDIKQSFKEDPAIRRDVNALKKKRAALETSQQPKAKGSTSFVANYETCRGCHAKQVAFWESTKHASAYLVLYAKNQHFDAECITCHTLGFKQDKDFMKIAQPLLLKGEPVIPGKPFVEKMMAEIFMKAHVTGAIDSREQPEIYSKLKKEYHASLAELSTSGKLGKVFMGVQCEHCHGNRTDHLVKNRRLGKVKEASCRECHRAPNAGEFSSAMIPKVACPSMGN